MLSRQVRFHGRLIGPASADWKSPLMGFRRLECGTYWILCVFWQFTLTARQVNLDRGFLVNFLLAWACICYSTDVVNVADGDLHYVGVFAAVGQHYKRLKTREGRVNDCPPRLAESVFKHYCTEFTLCENDKACEKQEICVCNKHCGKVCIDPSKSKYPVLHPVRINSVVWNRLDYVEPV